MLIFIERTLDALAANTLNSYSVDVNAAKPHVLNAL